MPEREGKKVGLCYVLGLPGVAALGPLRLLPAQGGQGPQTLVQMAEMRKASFGGLTFHPAPRPTPPAPTSGH